MATAWLSKKHNLGLLLPFNFVLLLNEIKFDLALTAILSISLEPSAGLVIRFLSGVTFILI